MTESNRENHPCSIMLSGAGDAGYGAEVQYLVRKLSAVCGEKNLYQWWDENIAPIKDRGVTLRTVIDRLNRLNAEHSNGWEIGSVYVDRPEP